MKKMISVLMAVFVLAAATTAFASDTKVNGKVFANWNLNMTDGAESANSFNVSRTYLTVKSKISDFTSVRVTSDIRSIVGYEGYTIILKYGYIDWTPQFGKKIFKFRFGLQPLIYTANLNKFWGRRYIEKTVADRNLHVTSSDLGLSAFMNLGEQGKSGYVAIQVLNGTKYSKVKENNKNKDFGVIALLKPFSANEDMKRSRLVGQFYAGTQNEHIGAVVDTVNNQIVVFENSTAQFKNQILSVGGLLGYKEQLDIGFEVNFQTYGQGYDAITAAELDDKKLSAISFFGTLYLNGMSESSSFGKTLNIFGRYDIFDPNTDVGDDGNSLFIIGLECSPTKGFKASLNFRSTSFQADGVDSESYLYLNTYIKF